MNSAMITDPSQQTKLLVGPPGLPEQYLAPATSSSSSDISNDGDYDSFDEYYDPDEAKDNVISKSAASTEPVKCRTRCPSVNFLSSGNPCLDFFFLSVPENPARRIMSGLAAAWGYDPLTALKLVCNLRGVRGTGKADRQNFYVCALWLHENHPKTLALNLPSFAEFGYLKDLLEILTQILERKHTTGKPTSKGKKNDSFIVQEDKSSKRKRRRDEKANRALNFYNSDESYQFLHDQIAGFFAKLLSSDLEHLKSGDVKKIGLAAKWCPSLDSSYDKKTLICESIACKMFPRDSFLEYSNLSDEHYAYHARRRLRKEVLSPLREALCLPEILVSSGKWDSIPYSKLTSLAMKRYKDLFLKHDAERAAEFLSLAESGGAKVSVGALLPHEILKHAFEGEEDDLAEAQWRQLVDSLAKGKKFKSCIAVCYNRYCIRGENKEAKKAAAALALLVSELAEDPWKGRLITFNLAQKLHRIEGDTLKDKLRFATKDQSYIDSLNIQGVFDEILRVATEGRLPAENMLKRVFVFSSMNFTTSESLANIYRTGQSYDHAITETDYEAICRNFEQSGYGSVVPEIVFWNLEKSKGTPVLARQNGVALVSGYSKNLVKVFLEMDGELSPEAIMAAAISGDEYQKLVVFD